MKVPLSRCALLMSLFSLTAAADCPQPRGKENLVLTKETLLINDFPEGSAITLECANGYVNESGSGVASCFGGSWTEPDLVCKKRDCGPVPPQPNMSFNTSGGTLFGARVTVMCDKGFEIQGSSYKHCYATGWAGRSRCEMITCPKPADVTNGRSLWASPDDPKYGETVGFACRPGYALVGRDAVTCGEGGEYDSPPPVCEAAPTAPPATPSAAPPAPSTAPPAASTAPPVASTAPPTTPPAPSTAPPAASTAHTIKTAAAAATSPPSAPDTHVKVVGDDKYTRHVPVAVSVICTSLGVVVVALVLHRFYLRRKGSYDTREDLKPELLQFQNL